MVDPIVFSCYKQFGHGVNSNNNSCCYVCPEMDQYHANQMLINNNSSSRLPSPTDNTNRNSLFSSSLSTVPIHAVLLPQTQMWFHFLPSPGKQHEKNAVLRVCDPPTSPIYSSSQLPLHFFHHFFKICQHVWVDCLSSNPTTQLPQPKQPPAWYTVFLLQPPSLKVYL